IQGTVLDKSGATMSGATVEITSKELGITRSVVSNEEGYFRFDLLPIGRYSVKVTKEGFKSWLQTVEVMVGQTLTINPDLGVGSQTETIEVTGESPLADVTKTDVSLNITPTEVEQMPILNRDVADLAYLAPGVK